MGYQWPFLLATMQNSLKAFGIRFLLCGMHRQPLESACDYAELMTTVWNILCANADAKLGSANGRPTKLGSNEVPVIPPAQTPSSRSRSSSGVCTPKFGNWDRSIFLRCLTPEQCLAFESYSDGALSNCAAINTKHSASWYPITVPQQLCTALSGCGSRNISTRARLTSAIPIGLAGERKSRTLSDATVSAQLATRMLT